MPVRVIPLCLRGLTLICMIMASYLNTESDDIAACNSFVMGGISGAYALVTIGFLLEAGVGKESDPTIEYLYLGSAVILNTTCAILAMLQFSHGGQYMTEIMNKGLLSALAALVYLIDLAVMCMTLKL